MWRPLKRLHSFATDGGSIIDRLSKPGARTSGNWVWQGSTTPLRRRVDEDANRKMGRPTINPDGESMTPRQVRMDDARREKCRRLGGAGWIRDRIDEASDPAEPRKRRK